MFASGKSVIFGAVIHTQTWYQNPPGETVLLGRLQLTLSCDSPNTLRRFALGARNVCLVGENPTSSALPLYRHARVYGPTDYGHA